MKLNQDPNDGHQHHDTPTKDILSGSVIDHSIYSGTGDGRSIGSGEESSPPPPDGNIIQNGPPPTTDLTPLHRKFQIISPRINVKKKSLSARAVSGPKFKSQQQNANSSKQLLKLK